MISFIPTYVTKKENVTDFKTLAKTKKVRVCETFKTDDGRLVKVYRSVTKYKSAVRNWSKFKARWKKNRELLYHFCIDNIPQYYEGQYLGGTSYKHAIHVTYSDMQLAYGLYNSTDEFPFSVNEFSYNGFGGTSNDKKMMSYKAKFIKWSGDPGIMVMMCSDNKERHIPTFAVPGSFIIPRTADYNKQIIFGTSSKS